MKDIELTADNYFEYVKQKRHTSDMEKLQRFRENATYLLEKFKRTNQITGMKKLMFIINSIEKEAKAVQAGINQYVFKDDILDFINNVSSKVVKIIELENYPREIPDDIIEKYESVKDVFDKFYIVFTDYTGEIERQVEKQRRDKDPILFGTFHNTEEKTLSEKFYYIGDWVDEYCDLTLEKMVTEMKTAKEKNISHKLYTPSTLDEIRKELDSYVYERGEYIKREIVELNKNNITNKSGSIFNKVMRWFK
jgi:hypothetical protein